MKKFFQQLVKFANAKKIGLLYLPITLVIVLFILLPLVNLVQQALTTPRPYDYESYDVNGRNFQKLIADQRFTTAISNTLLLLFVVSPLLLVLFFTIALLVTKCSLRCFSNTFIALIFAQLFVSAYSMGIVFLVLFGARTNVLNTLLGTNVPWNSPRTQIYPFLQLVIYYAWTMSALSILLFVFAISKIPQRIFLMARLDNLSFYKQVWFIYLPHLRRVFGLQVYLFLFQTLFFYPTIYEEPFALNCQTLATYIVTNLHEQSSPLAWSLAATAAVLLVVIALSSVLTMQTIKLIITRFWRRLNYVYF